MIAVRIVNFCLVWLGIRPGQRVPRVEPWMSEFHDEPR